MRKLSALSALPFLYAVSVFSQSANLPTFRPGFWQINSITTASDGRTVTSQTNLCAQAQEDFWKIAQDGMTCHPPKITPANGGIHVRVVCIYSLDNLNSRIESDVIEKFNADGTSFTVDGTSKTNTSYEQIPPRINTVHLQATAKRLGACPQP